MSPIDSNLQLFTVTSNQWSHFQYIQLYPAISSVFYHLQPVPAMRTISKMSCHFQLSWVNSIHSRNFQNFSAIAAISSLQAISIPFGHWAIPAFSSIYSHFLSCQTFSAISSHFKLFQAISSHIKRCFAIFSDSSNSTIIWSIAQFLEQGFTSLIQPIPAYN